MNIREKLINAGLPDNDREFTLSELIEAVGKEFRVLENHSHYGNGWKAMTRKGVIDMAYGDGSVETGQGETPEEAVAELYLKLRDN